MIKKVVKKRKYITALTENNMQVEPMLFEGQLFSRALTMCRALR